MRTFISISRLYRFVTLAEEKTTPSFSHIPLTPHLCAPFHLLRDFDIALKEKDINGS